ncbi:MAG: methyltransferase domain-containing protein [Nitrospirota bacterium]|nr:methyltransferase domain-containing protein [Nitrospirota bacterium]
MTQPSIDWNLVAEKFDLWLPHIAPVGEELLKVLRADASHDILDVACGTGEPALTLARRIGPGARIVAVDAAEGMVNAAATKARREGVAGIRFEAMPAEALRFADDTFDRVLCRFGVMLFQDPVAGLGEMWRVLKPGGRYAFAVWGDLDETSSFRILTEVLEPILPKGERSPFLQVTSLGSEAALTAAMESAGLANYRVTRHKLNYVFPDFDTYWDLAEASGVLKRQMDTLQHDQRTRMRDEVARMMDTYHNNGELVLPHVYVVVSGTR